MIRGPLASMVVDLSLAPDEHSEIGPSSFEAHRNCPGRRAFCSMIPIGESSEPAKEGQHAHHCLAVRLTTGEYPADMPEYFREPLDITVDYVLTLAHKAAAAGPVSILVEQRVGAPAVHPDLWGSLDVGIYHHATGHLDIVDLKFGEGIYVEEENNIQIKLYATYTWFQYKLSLRSCTVHISQPRIDCAKGANRPAPLPVYELPEILAEAAEVARISELPNQPRKPGPWCRFCPGSAICPERQAANESAIVVFNPAAVAVLPYDPVKLVAARAMIAQIKEWIANVESFVYSEMMRGVELPGLKLVPKQLSARKYVGDEKVTAAALEAVVYDRSGNDIGVEELHDAVYTRKLKSPAQFEAWLVSSGLKKKEAEGIIAKLTYRESTGTTVADESDPREPYLPDASSDFKAQ